jgi:hypothetical protein
VVKINPQYRLLQFDTSMYRKGAALTKAVIESTQSRSLHSHSFIILIEDVDIHFDSEAGFLPAIITLIEKTKTPFILTCERIPELLRHRKDLNYLGIDR